ncbi:MAG: polyprenyl synthetase family protein [Candidatus Heimdallarchaeota archaeon]
MDVKIALLETIEVVYNELQALFNDNGFKQANLGAFGDMFYKELDNYLTFGGKRVRPFLVRTAFDAVGGNHEEGNITKASLAIELLHNGSLLHDDVIDKDETRRGRPSFHVIFRDIYSKKKKGSFEKATDFGEAMSIFAGDLCFPYAIESIIQSGFPAEKSLRALHAFTEAFREVIDGVILETGNAILQNGTEASYRKMINLKTGALIRKAVEIGAILGGGSDSQIESLKQYCLGIGTAFQVQDDILGIFGNQEELGKPIGGDVREDKQTILRIHAIKKGSKEQVKRISELMGKEDVTLEELNEIRKIFEETGALNYSFNLIKEATKNAIESLEKAKPPLKEKPKMLLISLAKFLEERKS